MSFPTPPPEPPHAPPPPASAPYKASRRSRVVVWTIAAVIVGALATMIGLGVYRAAADGSREDKLVDTCEQEALRRLNPSDASRAAFTAPTVTRLPDDRAHVAAAVRLTEGRKPFRCEGRWDGDAWTVINFEFSG